MYLAAVGDNCMDVYDKEGKAFPGGNPVNVAVYYVRMGGNASYTGVVGTDKYGDIMKSAISEKRVDVSHVETKEGATAITHVEIIDGDRVFGEYEEGVMADFTLSASQLDYLRRQDMVVTALWGNVHNDLGKIKEGGAKIAFDAATRPDSEIARTAIPNTDYFFFSEDAGDSPALRDFMKDVFSRGPSVVVATMGEMGSIAYDGEKFHIYGIVPCEVADTMGAGDSYIAGFLMGVGMGLSIPECMAKGAENAAVTLGYSGAW